MRESCRGLAYRFWLPILAFFLAFQLTSVPTAAMPLSGVSHVFDAGSVTRLTQYFVPYYGPPPPRWKKRKKRRRTRRRVTTPKCAHPWAYSAGLRRCICVAEGFSLSNGQCIKLAELCSANGRWDGEHKTCQCTEGFVLRDGRCVDPQSEITSTSPVEGAQCLWPEVANEDRKTCGCAPGYKEQAGQCLGETGSEDNKQAQQNRSDGLLTTEIALIQQCLNEAGYLRGRIAARMTKRAWTAYWFFKQDYKIGSTPKGVHDAGAQQKLFALCPLAARAVRGTKYAALQSGTGQEVALFGRTNEASPADGESEPYKPQPVPKVYAKPEAGCLPDHLYRLIVKSYGKRSALKRCTQTCIAVPRGLSGRDIAEAEQRGVRWCRACLEVSSHLPLDDILKIERAADVQICTRPPARLPRWKRADGAPRVAYTKVRRLYRTLPTATDHGGDIAVIIGNKNYQGGLPANESAHSNAGAMYALLTEHLGFDQQNIIDLRDATREDLVRVFGGEEDHRGDLWKRLQKSPAASMLIYFAGHGTTSLDRSDSYLLPVDAVEHREARTAYPMSRLYANIAQLGAKSAMLLLEAGFGRDQSAFVFAPNMAELAVRALPAQPIKGLTVLAAAEKDQRPMEDPQYGIGLFTRYLIEGLAGRADLEPIGNNDLKIDAVELYAYTARMVDLAARKSYGLLQMPSISRQGNGLVSRVQAQLQ